MKITSRKLSSNVLILLKMNNGDLIQTLDVDLDGEIFDTKEDLKEYIIEAMEENEWKLSEIINFNEAVADLVEYYSFKYVKGALKMDNKTALDWVRDRLAFIGANCDMQDEDVKNAIEVLNYIKNKLEN